MKRLNGCILAAVAAFAVTAPADNGCQRQDALCRKAECSDALADGFINPQQNGAGDTNRPGVAVTEFNITKA